MADDQGLAFAYAQGFSAGAHFLSALQDVAEQGAIDRRVLPGWRMMTQEMHAAWLMDKRVLTRRVPVHEVDDVAKQGFGGHVGASFRLLSTGHFCT